MKIYEKNQRATNLLLELKRRFRGILDFSDNISNEVKLINNNTSLGVCRKYSICDTRYYNIYLNKKMLKCNDEQIKNTLLHELIHTIDGCFNHGSNFKKQAEIVNKLYGYNVQRGNSYQEFKNQLNFKYEVCCTNCGAKNRYFKKTNVVKHPSLYHCSCGGKLEVKQLD